MRVKYKIHNQHGLNFLTGIIVGWVDLFTQAAYRDIVLDLRCYCQQPTNQRVNTTENAQKTTHHHNAQ
jgi:hypothetical protein